MANNTLKEELILNTGQFDAKIDNVIKKVEELKSKGKDVGSPFNTTMGKMIEKATGFNGSMGSVLTVVGKFSGALGIAMGVGEAFNKTINSSQALADEYGRTQSTVNTVVDNFFQSLASADFSPFLNGMDSMISKAREAFNALDDLWNMQLSFSNSKALNNLKFQEKLLFIRENKNSKDPKVQKQVEEAKKELLSIINQNEQNASNVSKQVIKTINEKIKASTNTNISLSQDDLDKLFTVDNNMSVNRKKINDGYTNYQKELSKLYIDDAKETGWVATENNPYQRLSSKAQKKKSQLEQKYRFAIAGNQLYNKESDEGLQGYSDLYKQGINAKQESLNQRKQSLRYIGETSTTRGNRNTTSTPKVKVPSDNAKVYKEEAKTVQEIEDNITVLNKKLKDTAPNSNEYKAISSEIKKWKDMLDVKEEPKIMENASKIKDINSNIAIFQSRLEDTVYGSEEWLELTKKIKEEQKKLKDYQDGSVKDFLNQIAEIENKLQNDNLTAEARIKLNETKESLQNKINAITDNTYIKVTPIVGEAKNKSDSFDNAQTNVNNVLDQYDKGIIDYDTAKAEIDKINTELQNIGLQPIKVHIETDFEKTIGTLQKGGNAVLGAFQGIDNVVNDISSLSTAISEGGNAWQIFMGALQTGVGIINAVGSAIQAFNTIQELLGTTATATAGKTAAAGAQEVATSEAVTSSKAKEGIASGVSSGAKLPFPYNIIAIAAIMSVVLGGLALMSSFANGGIVGGNRYAGDGMLARVNSGEMILNGSQQKNLFKLLNSGVASNSSMTNVQFVIKGKDLVGVARNYNDKMNKVR